MTKSFDNLKEIIQHAQDLLDGKRAAEALAVVERCGFNSPEIRNARGVCLMRMNETDRAVDVFRALVLRPGGVVMNTELPTTYMANYATALLLSQNVSGCERILDELNGSAHPAVARLRVAIARWKRSLGLLEKLRFSFYGVQPGKPVALGFEPGDLGNGLSRPPASSAE